MAEMFIIFRHDTQQYYFDMSSRGCPLWVDVKEQAEYLTELEAEDLWSFIKDNQTYGVEGEVEILSL